MSAPDFRLHFDRLTARKPFTWDACPLRSDLTAVQVDMLRQLPVVETVAAPLDDIFTDPSPGECVVRVGGRHFYVNPEGYTYARYVFEFEAHRLNQPKSPIEP